MSVGEFESVCNLCDTKTVLTAIDEDTRLEGKTKQLVLFDITLPVEMINQSGFSLE